MLPLYLGLFWYAAETTESTRYISRIEVIGCDCRTEINECIVWVTEINECIVSFYYREHPIYLSYWSNSTGRPLVAIAERLTEINECIVCLTKINERSVCF